MKSLRFLIVILLSAMSFVACNTKGDSATLELARTSLYFSDWGASAQTISYNASNAVSVSVGSYSTGWNATVDMYAQKITVWPVGTNEEGMTNDDLPKEGSIVINALNEAGDATSYSIYVYISSAEVLDEEGRANCYVVAKPSASYTFDVMHRPDGVALGTKEVKLLWQSNSDVVKNVEFVEDKVIFYIPSSADDESRLEDTNAVIAAYNGAGEVIWSWHLWIVNENPLLATDTYSNSKTFMRQNLGAFTNSNGEANEQKILDSYGMYYQWGRKDPFPRPLYFNASGAENEGCYNIDGVYLSENYLERASTDGTVAYTLKNPMHYICNSENSEYSGDIGNGVGDWLVTADNRLWSDTQKSVYDPCPYGWRVPTADDMLVLKLADAEDNTPLETARGQYGWHLSDDNNNKFFYPACGRRRYNDGKVENMNSKDYDYHPDTGKPVQPEPWEGHYWTSSTTTDGQAVSLYFDLTTTRTINKFVGQQPRFRANGFQIRCVRE